ncbi:MAG: MBL fold metallo-hydrolase [Candidatus Nezhaarchaeota archaeon]|nr:MBL fold metallo-hydrolase [Candidatus Nezhaarchaeota archaeon]
MDNLSLLCLGGCREVGRSAFLLEAGEKKILLDYGISLNDVPSFPLHISPSEIDAVLLSHPHLDHSGSLPLLFSSRVKPPVYTTPLSKAMLEYLMEDMMKISGRYLPYEEYEVREMLDKTVAVDYKDVFRIGDVEIKPLNAGHVPGSCMFLIKLGRLKALYTGDINTVDTRLIYSAEIQEILAESPIDLLVVEATYGSRLHDDRRATEKSFVSSVLDVLENNGLVLVPAFAYGRAQEMLCVLEAYKSGFPLYMDGMARRISPTLLSFKHYLKDPATYESALQNTLFVRGSKERRKLLKGSGIVISPAGMLKGGPALFYARSIAKRSNSAIFLVSYQIPGTPGDNLLTLGRIDGEAEKVACSVKWFDFSSHVGKDELVRFVSAVAEASGNSTKVVIVHGDEASSASLETNLRDMGFNALLPRNGDLIKL